MNSLRKVRGRYGLILGAITLIGLFAATPAYAAQTRGGNDIVIGRDAEGVSYV